MSPRKGSGRKESTRDKLLEWNSFYSTHKFGIGIECTKCKQWRRVYDYDEEYQVPEDWECKMTEIEGKNLNCKMPSTLSAEDFASEKFVPGSLVWAKSHRYPSWPAMVEDDPDEELYYKIDEDDNEEYHVTYITEKPERVQRDWVPSNNLTAFTNPSNNKNVKKLYQKSLKESTIIAEKALKMTISERLKKFSFAVLSTHKFPAARRDKKAPKIPVVKNGRGRPIVVKRIEDKSPDHSNGSFEQSTSRKRLKGAASAVPESVSSLQDTSNDASTTISEASNGSVDSAAASGTSVSPIPEEDTSSIPHAAVANSSSLLATSEDSVDPSTVNDETSCSHASTSAHQSTQELDPEAAAQAEFDKELEQYSDGETDSMSDDVPVPQYLLARDVSELFSDVDSDELLSEDEAMEVDDALEFENVPYQPILPKVPEDEKYVCESEEDIWDINNPKYKASGYKWTGGFKDLM